MSHSKSLLSYSCGVLINYKSVGIFYLLHFGVRLRSDRVRVRADERKLSRESDETPNCVIEYFYKVFNL